MSTAVLLYYRNSMERSIVVFVVLCYGSFFSCAIQLYILYYYVDVQYRMHSTTTCTSTKQHRKSGAIAMRCDEKQEEKKRRKGLSTTPTTDKWINAFERRLCYRTAGTLLYFFVV